MLDKQTSQKESLKRGTETCKFRHNPVLVTHFWVHEKELGYATESFGAANSALLYYIKATVYCVGLAGTDKT